MGDRKCSECKHYVVKDEKINYEQNGCGTYKQKIYGCELWDCEFQPKEVDPAKSKPENLDFDPNDVTGIFKNVSSFPTEELKGWSSEEIRKKIAEERDD